MQESLHHRLRRLAVLAGLIGSVFGQAQTPLSFIQGMTTQQLVESGREAFLARCSGCHGVLGDGQGPAAPLLNPRPRNLVSGSFKFRTTPQGTLPTLKDLLRTIDQGILGTSMPPFREVAAQEKLAIAVFVRSLRSQFNETLSDQTSGAFPSPPKEIFAKKATLMEAAARGKKSFVQGCLSCHGAEGRGDGPAAADLVDNDEIPIRPANLRRNYVKGGKTAGDLYRAISTGLDGSPMPAYDLIFNEKQRWDIVAYLFYLRGREEGRYGEKDELP